MSAETRVRHPALWVPTSYLAEGIPFAMVIWVAATMFKDLGHSDGDITVATASIGIAWSLKPLWAAFLDTYRTKKFFVLSMEFLMAVVLGLAALALKLPNYFAVIVALLWVTAFSSATQDICVDGVYISALDEKGQADWIGLQGVFWNVGRIFATAAVVAAAGALKDSGFLPQTAWMYGLGLAAAVMAGLGVYHYFILPSGATAPPKDDGATRATELKDGVASYRQAPGVDDPDERVMASQPLRFAFAGGIGLLIGGLIAWSSGYTIGLVIGVATTVAIAVGWREHVPTVLAFFRKKAIWGMLLFVFLYRTGEGFLLVEAPLFMQAPIAQGGLGLTLAEKAWIDGTISTGVSLLAGILGGKFAARFGLKRTLLTLAFFMNVPHICYVVLSQLAGPAHPVSMLTIQILVTIEKFGYSFGMVGNMLYMMQQIAPGKFKMTHYAYCTALMNLVLVPTQAASGRLADWLGYKSFFIFVVIASAPSILAAWIAPFPIEEGKEGDTSSGEPKEPATAAA